jgi:hypothetical protein
MKRFHGNRILAKLLFLFLSVEMLSAAPPDSKLLSLVPPGTQLMAGVSNPTPAGKPESFLLMSPKNLIDRADFMSLAGVDDSKVIRQMIFVAGGDDVRGFKEHSILMSGHFDQARIFKAAIDNGAASNEYRGFQVLVQPPFERELGTFKDVRWLAVVDSNLALFGTKVSVQQELDRYLARSIGDPSLMQKVARLRRDDATWSVLATFKCSDAIEHALGSLDPNLANLVHGGSPFQIGVHYGKKVEIEYEVAVPSITSAPAISNSSAQSLVAGNRNGLSLLPRLDLTEDRASAHGVVKIETNRYAAWLAECARSAVIKRSN